MNALTLLLVILLASPPIEGAGPGDVKSLDGLWAVEETDAYGTSHSTWKIETTEDSIQISTMTYYPQGEPREERFIVRDYTTKDGVLMFTIVNSSTWIIAYRMTLNTDGELVGKFHSKDDFMLGTASGEKLETTGSVKATRKPTS